MLSNKPEIHDQYTDRSGKVLVKIAAQLEDPELAEAAVGLLFNMEDRMSKLANRANFPVDTPEDTFLSRLYFEGQKHLMKEAEAKALDERIGVREALYNLEPPEFQDVSMEKDAGLEEFIELIPGVRVTSEEELIKVGEEFEKNFLQLDYADRLRFADEFAKLAFLTDNMNIPENISLYAGIDTELRPDVKEQLHFRKVACDRKGVDGSQYMKLAEAIDNLDYDTVGEYELFKLAEAVHTLDELCGLTDTSYDKRLPDAWHAILKTAANEENNSSSLSDTPKPTLDRSDIISRYGEQALDEVENPDGTINEARLKQIMQMFGDGRDVKDAPVKKDKAAVNEDRN